MAYLALYRQYRPRTFDEVLGQDIITRTLKNQIVSGRVAHAYLFCGSRGTGKTSTAKILARAINCLAPVEGNPCGQCEICKMPDSAISSDIIEIDAASNNGVDEIREIRDKIRYGPAITKFKVYIIDEVHMLSAGAFNALLKTLEEPPAHAVFILATTEMHKLPATIVSRCQRFDFQQMGENTILCHMQTILKDLHRTADMDALKQIATAAEGGMRDALSILDQCLMITDHLTLGDVYDAIGYVGGQSVDALMEAMEDGDVASMLKVIDAVAQSGANLSVFVRECMQAIRDKLIQSQGVIQARYSYAMEVLAQTQTQMRYATRPRVLLDAAAVRLCMPQGDDSQIALLARVEALEQRLTQLETQPLKATVRQAIKPQNDDRQTEKAEVPVTEDDDLPWEEDTVTPPWDDMPANPVRTPTKKAEIPVAEDDELPWEEDTATPPWDVVPANPVRTQASENSIPPPTLKDQSGVDKEISRVLAVEEKPKIASDTVPEDAKAMFLAKMGKVDAGVSQSIRLCRQIARINGTVHIAFAKGDEVFVGALRQHLQDLVRIAGEVYGEDVQVKVVTEDQLPKTPIDRQVVAQKAQEIFGVPIEIEEI